MKFFGVLASAFGLAFAGCAKEEYAAAPGCGYAHYSGLPSIPAPHPPFSDNFKLDYFDMGPRCGLRARTYTTGYVPKLRPTGYEQHVEFGLAGPGKPLKYLAEPEATTQAALHYYGKDFFTRGGMSGILSAYPVKGKPFVAVPAKPPCGTCSK